MEMKNFFAGFLFVLISFLAYSQDTLKPNQVMYIKTLPDSIFINKNNKVEHYGMVLTRGEARRLMKTKANVRTEVRMTNMFRAFTAIPFIEGSIHFVDFGIGASKGDFNWLAGGIGLVDYVVAVIMQQQANKHFDKAVKLYNTKPGLVGIKKIKPELGLASKDFGISLWF